MYHFKMQYHAYELQVLQLGMPTIEAMNVLLCKPGGS